MATAPEESKKPVMLCLHGYGQNSTVFTERLQTFRSKIKNKVEFLIPDAPYGVYLRKDEPKPDYKFALLHPEKYESTARHAWYLYPDRFTSDQGVLDVKALFESLDTLDAETDFAGLNHAMEEVKEILDATPAIKYVMGFSQGASLLAMMVQKGLIDKEKKLIFISGSSIKMADDVKFPHASYHIIGKTDTVVDGSFSLRLAKHFEKSTLISHDGGHVCPRISASVLDAL